MLTFEQIKDLVELIAARGLQGFELERSGFRLKIDGKQPAVAPLQSAPAATPTPVAAQVISPALAPEATTAEPPAEAQEDLYTILSPIVGTFYRSPSPDASPFIQPGDRIKKGQVLCIVEAMKLMNEIESDVDGVIVEVLPENAQAVEFEEPLFKIRLG